MILYRIIVRIMCFLSCLCLLSGCMTSHTRKEFKRLKEFQTDQSPMQIQGTYYGNLNTDRGEYAVFYFPYFPWASNNGYPSHMAILLSADSSEEPLFVGEGIYEFKYYQIYNRCKINAKLRYDGNKCKSIILPQPGSDKIQNLSAALIVANTDLSQLSITPINEIEHYVYLKATKYGYNSEVSSGRVNSDGVIEWDKIQVLSANPSFYKWRSPWNNCAYFITIPFDIITLPIQLPAIIFEYSLSRSMSVY